MHWASGRVLHDRTFRAVTGGEVLSMLGDFAYQVAFAWLVLSATGSAVTLAAVMICNLVPNGLLILVGGAVTDRWSAKHVMFCSHLSRGLLVSGLCAVTLTGSVRIWQFYAIAAAFGLADAFFWPASGSLVPLLVDAGDLPAANAVLAAGEQVAMFAAPLLGGTVMTAFSPSAVLAVNAVTFFTAAVTAMRAPAAVSSRQDQRRPARGLLSDITAGLFHACRAAEVRAVLVTVSASGFWSALPPRCSAGSTASSACRGPPCRPSRWRPWARWPPSAPGSRFYLASLLMLLAGAIVALNPAARTLTTQNRAPAPAGLSDPP